MRPFLEVKQLGLWTLAICVYESAGDNHYEFMKILISVERSHGVGFKAGVS